MIYSVTIKFCGYCGAENIYEVEADSRDEAELLALQEAQDDLEVESIEELEEED